MSGLIKVNLVQFKNLESMSDEEYGEFLEEKLIEIKDDCNFKKYKFIKENEYYRFFEYPPFLVKENGTEIKFEESNSKKKRRLDIKKKYRDVYVEDIINKEEVYDFSADEEWIEVSKVQRLLGITRKTLLNIEDRNGEVNFVTKKINRRLYVERKSLLDYMNKRHYESTGVDIEEMYFKVKELKMALTKNESDINKRKLKEIVESKEYTDKWHEYFSDVPEKSRVKRVTPSILVDIGEEDENENTKTISKANEKVEIFVRRKDGDFFDEYNPNLRISRKKIKSVPKLYQANYCAALLGVVSRTILKYCELGYIRHFKVGSKYMISEEDFKEGKLFIKNKKRRTKTNVGRKSKAEKFLYNYLFEDNLYSELFEDKLGFMDLEFTLEDKELIELSIKNLEKKKEKIEKRNFNEDEKYVAMMDVNSKLKKQKAALARHDREIIRLKRELILSMLKDKKLEELLSKNIREYTYLNISLREYNKELQKAINEGDEQKVTDLNYIIADFSHRLKEKKDYMIENIRKSVLE